MTHSVKPDDDDLLRQAQISRNLVIRFHEAINGDNGETKLSSALRKLATFRTIDNLEWKDIETGLTNGEIIQFASNPDKTFRAVKALAYIASDTGMSLGNRLGHDKAVIIKENAIKALGEIRTQEALFDIYFISADISHLVPYQVHDYPEWRTIGEVLTRNFLEPDKRANMLKAIKERPYPNGRSGSQLDEWQTKGFVANAVKNMIYGKWWNTSTQQLTCRAIDFEPLKIGLLEAVNEQNANHPVFNELKKLLQYN